MGNPEIGETVTHALLHPGFSRYHTVGLIVPFLAALSPMILTRLFEHVPITDPGRALIFGFIVFGISYVLMTYVPGLREEQHAVNKALLLGLLVTEFTVFSSSPKTPSVVLIAFFLFIYLFAVAKSQ
jgi:hypothetical protein